MKFEQFQRVRMVNDKYEKESVRKDALGYIIEIYSDGNLELEFSNEAGETIATIVASPDDVEPAPE